MEAAYWGPMGSARRLRALFREWILLGERERGERETEGKRRERKRERGERKREKKKRGGKEKKSESKSEKRGQIGAVAAVRRPMRRTVR